MGYYSAPPPPDPLAPARRASILLIVVGLLMTLFGACVGASIMSVSDADLKTMLEASPFSKNMKSVPPGMSLVEFARKGYNISSAVGITVGPILFVLGIVVRKGGRIPVVLSTAFCGTFVVFELFSGVLGCGGSPLMAFSSCLGVIPSILLGIAIGWLLQVLKSLPQIEAMRQQWQAHYAASQQQQQAYYQAYAPQYAQPGAPPPGVVQPPSGQAPIAGYPGIGYGAMPPVAPPAENSPPVRHPPLPPDAGNTPENR